MLFQKNPRAIMIISKKGVRFEIKLLSFDVWDTLIIDDSDEGEKKKVGRPTKKQERRDLILKLITKTTTPLAVN